jgi:hypothetical protein
MKAKTVSHMYVKPHRIQDNACKATLDFTKASERVVFSIFRCLQELKNEIPNLKIKIKKTCS